MAKSGKGFRANTKAAKSAYAVKPGSKVGGKGVAKYPVDSAKRARAAISYVQRHGSTAEKKAVYAKVRKEYPAIAARSTVIPTRTGTGRHHGQPKGTTNRK